MKNKNKIKNPIILVHGFADTAWTPWWGDLKDYLKEYDPGVEIYQLDFGKKIKSSVFNTEKSIFGTAVGSVKDYAEELKEFIEELGKKDLNIIGHSMGGITSRWFIEELNGGRYVKSLITLGSPHQGTKLAYFGAFTQGARDLEPESELLQTLNSNKLDNNISYTALWGGNDFIYFNKEKAKMPKKLVEASDNARNIYAGDFDHAELLSKKEVLDKYIDFLI